MKCPVLLFVIDPAVEPVGTVRNASRRFARTCGKTVFVFPHVRQFPSGCPLLSFLVLFSFFTLPIPIGVGTLQYTVGLNRLHGLQESPVQPQAVATPSDS